MKKFRMFAMLMMLTLLLSGCGPTLEEKIADVQASNAITTADVADLLELREYTVEKQTPSDAWMEQWPDIEIYKINGENILLMQATKDVHVYVRDELVKELKWDGIVDREVPILDQLKTDFPLETGHYGMSHAIEAKNIIACYVPYRAYDLSVLESGNEEEKAQAYDIQKESSALADMVGSVFSQDINGMQVINRDIKGENFDAQAIILYYQVPLEVDGNTTYDVFASILPSVTVHEDVWRQHYQQEMTVTVENTDGMIDTMDSITQHFVLDEPNHTITDMMTSEEIVGPKPLEQLNYQVTVTIGDMTETLDITEPIAAQRTTK